MTRRGRPPRRPEAPAPAVWTEADRLEEFEERAAIMEYDGGLPRAEAEAAARKLIDDRRRRGEQGRLL